MHGIRWITGIPIGYLIYIGIMHVNLKLIGFLIKYLPFEILWSIETIIVNTFIAIYFGIAFAYFILPRDNIALINNFKIKILYFAVSFWSVIQFLILGVAIYNSFHDRFDIYQILYPIFAFSAMWLTFNAVKLVDFKHNQPARDYFDTYIKEQQNGRDVIDISN